jgi:hypothetical protein
MISESQSDAVEHFWRWFAANAERLKSLYSTDRLERLATEVNRELDRVDPRLAWEIGAGRKRPFLLTISAEGNQNLRQIADLMVERAPALEEWEFYSSRPARLAPEAVRLPESGERFETARWEFVPIERPEKGRLDLVVVDNQLAQSGRETALKAVSLYLDQVLGEDTVETWIGRLNVETRLAAHGKKTFKMAELSDYLLWVTHRENKPLRRRPTDRPQ